MRSIGLVAENDYFADTPLDSLEIREPLMNLARHSYNSQIGGSIWSDPVVSSGTLLGQMQPLPVSYVPNDFEFTKGEKVYEMKNHLGNVLLVTTDLKLGQEIGSADDTTDYYLPEVVAATDYYPFGMAMTSRTWQAGTYRYGFNGKEADGEWNGEGNSYDFGARVYDGRLGRWMSVDRMEIKYPSLSTYNAFGSNPIIMLDSAGNDIYFFNENGKLLFAIKADGNDVGYKIASNQNIDLAINFLKEQKLSKTFDPSAFEGMKVDGKSDWLSKIGSTSESSTLSIDDATGGGISLSAIVGPGFTGGVEGVYFSETDEWGFFRFFGLGLGVSVGGGGYYLEANKNTPGKGADSWLGYFHLYTAGFGPISGTYFWSVNDETESDLGLFTEWNPRNDDGWSGQAYGLAAGWKFGLAKGHTNYWLIGKTSDRLTDQQLSNLKEQNEICD
jgi:RHS repeat-associated protein